MTWLKNTSSQIRLGGKTWKRLRAHIFRSLFGGENAGQIRAVFHSCFNVQKARYLIIDLSGSAAGEERYDSPSLLIHSRL